MKSPYRVVVIGGGVVGASVLCHLAREGWSDVCLLERSVLTAGSSGYAAGGVHALNADPNMAAPPACTIDLLSEIEAEAGHVHRPGVGRGFAENRRYIRETTDQFHSRRYVMTHPNEQLPTGRPLKMAPARKAMTEAGCVWGTSWDLEVPLYFAAKGFRETPSLRRSDAFPIVAAQYRPDGRTMRAAGQDHRRGRVRFVPRLPQPRDVRSGARFRGARVVAPRLYQRLSRDPGPNLMVSQPGIRTDLRAAKANTPPVERNRRRGILQDHRFRQATEWQAVSDIHQIAPGARR